MDCNDREWARDIITNLGESDDLRDCQIECVFNLKREEL